MDLKTRLLKESEKDYKKFSASLIPNIDNVLGVRLPTLRKIAKDLYSDENWQTILDCKNCEYMEETMIQGMIIGLIKDNPEKILEYIKNFVPKIDNWSVCDCFCGGLKFTKKNKELVWKFIQSYFNSTKEFEKRFAFIMCLSHFIDEEYIDKVLQKIDEFNDDRYYARMGTAWALSVCMVKFPDKTLEYLNVSKLDVWTYNKSIQKMCESFRIDKDTKSQLKKLVKKENKRMNN